VDISEPKIVIAHREHLWQLLSEALQLEHMIMCQYLFAQFSLKDGARDGLLPFEMHYVMGNMTPHHEPAWALLAERAHTLAHRCSQVAAEPSHHADLSAVTGEAAAHAHAIADALTAQVPAELRSEPDQAIRL
jgi:hypothetical protein